MLREPHCPPTPVPPTSPHPDRRRARARRARSLARRLRRGTSRARPSAGEKNGIDVAQVNGLIDPPNAQLILDSIRGANERRAEVLVIQLASGGAVDVDVQELVRAIRRSAVPVVVWVGPSGSRAKGAAALLAQAAPVASIANGAGIGPAYPAVARRPRRRSRSTRSRRQLESLARANGRRPAGAAATATRTLSSGPGPSGRRGQPGGADARRGHRHARRRARSRPRPGPRELSTARVVGEGSGPSPGAEPDRAVPQARARRPGRPHADAARRSRTSCSSPGCASSCSSSSPPRSASPAPPGPSRSSVRSSGSPTSRSSGGRSACSSSRSSASGSTRRRARTGAWTVDRRGLAPRRFALPLRGFVASRRAVVGAAPHVRGCAAVHDGGGAGRDPSPLLDAHRRSRGHGRRDGTRPRSTSIPTVSSGYATRSGGPARTGRRRSRPATRSGSSRSTASCSRSSPRPVVPATTASVDHGPVRTLRTSRRVGPSCTLDRRTVS